MTAAGTVAGLEANEQPTEIFRCELVDAELNTTNSGGPTQATVNGAVRLPEPPPVSLTPGVVTKTSSGATIVLPENAGTTPPAPERVSVSPPRHKRSLPNSAR